MIKLSYHANPNITKFVFSLPPFILAGESSLTEEEKSNFIVADVDGKQEILLRTSTSSARAALYVDDLCGEKTDCKGVVNDQVAKKIGEKKNYLRHHPSFIWIA